MSTFNKSIFAKNLIYYMEQKGIDRNQLCEDLDFKYPTVTDWIKARKYPRVDKIEKLANYFGIKKSDLIEAHADNRRSALIKKVEQIPESEIPRAEAVLSAVFDDVDK